MDLAQLNAAKPDDAAAQLAACCASTLWVEDMLARRPFPDLASLLAAAAEVWWDLNPDDWIEAFGANPSVGETPNGVHGPWAADEAAWIVDADADTLQRLLASSRAYEEHFGFRFVAFTPGRTPQEILSLCDARSHTEEPHEMTVAATEQARVTNHRLRRMLSE